MFRPTVLRPTVLRPIALSLIVVSVLLALVAPVPVAAQADAAPVVINEVVTKNDTVAAADGSTPDWIELFNPSSTTPVDLTNWALSDDPVRPQKWVFPAGTNLAPLSYLVVFASGDGINLGSELHTNFSLSTDEYLGLVDPTGAIVDTIASIPDLDTDHSWGTGQNGEKAYFDQATPAATNGAATDGRLDDVLASPGRGFFDQAVNVTLTSEIPGATIRFTTDGSAPTTSRGTVYGGPVNISETTVLRAYSYRNGWVSRPPVTHTYIFTDDVVTQSRMSQSVVSGNLASVLGGLESLPVISLVAQTSPGTPRWAFGGVDDSPVAVEMVFPDGTDGFQVDAGAHEVGGHSVGYPKDSLRLVFGTEWGESELDFPVFEGADNPALPATDSFKRLTLRMGAHDTGFYGAHARSYIRSRFHDETMLDLGSLNTHGRFVNVFLNGEYWGQYHLREHFDDHFMASYEGGDNEEYVGVNRGAVSVGAGPAWGEALAEVTDWSDFTKYVDEVAYVDWMLLTEYGGNTWDLRATQNWRAAGPASIEGDDPAQFVFQSSDPDISLVSTTARTSYPGPGSSWTHLRNEGDPEFLTLVNDRIHELFFGDGVLTPAANQARIDRLSSRIQASVFAEWARWSRMSNTTWTTSIDWLRNTLAVQRTTNVVNDLRARGFMSPVDPPGLAASGDIAAHDVIAVTNPNGSGTIWATVDGTDPRQPGGGASASAFSIDGSFRVDHDLTLTTRIKSGSDWSAVVSADYVAVPAANAPIVESIPNLTDVAGFSAGYAVDATDPSDDALTYSANELPAGLSIDPATGVISGVPVSAATSTTMITVSDGGHESTVAFEWTIHPGQVPAPSTPLVLNEYNAVQATSLLGDDGADVRFGRIEGNGGDWLEFVVTEDGTDLRGWSVELSSRKGNELLAVDDVFTFGSAGVLADLRAGTIITIAEDGLEDASYDPDNNDWHIAAIARTGFGSTLLDTSATDFDSNRHEFRVRVLDSAGAARSPFMGETDQWDSAEGNVSGTEVMALCSVPAANVDPVGVYDDQKASTFGVENNCGGVVQQLIFLRGGMPGDVNCDLELTPADSQAILHAGTGKAAIATRCPVANAGAVYLSGGDINADGTTNLLDALIIAQG